MKRRDRKQKSDDKMDDSWLLPYADMLTLLLALFIVLFSMSEIDVKKFENLASIFKSEFSSGGGMINDGESIVTEEDSPEEEEKDDEKDEDHDNEEEAFKEFQQLLDMQQMIEEYIVDHDLADTLATQLSGEGLLVTVRTDITFDSGSARVKENGQDIAKEMAQMISSDPPHDIVVNGHADDRPMENDEFASNWELSTMRAIQFMYLLIEESDLEPKWFSAKGYGEYHPLVENTSEENRAKNRRVEVLIQPNYDIDDITEEKQEELGDKIEEEETDED